MTDQDMNGDCASCQYKTSRKRQDVLTGVRQRHNERFCNNPYLKGLAYFDGWSQISTLTNRCFVMGGRSLASLNEENRKLTIEFAQKVSDLFYEYTLHKPKCEGVLQEQEDE